MDEEIKLLSDSLINEIVNAVGLPRNRFWFRLFNPVFHAPTRRLAEIGVTLNRKIAAEGVDNATGWALTNWCRDIQVNGAGNVPASGPVLVVSNHAGAYDSFVICSQMKRRDFKVISSDISFFKNLPNVTRHAIFLTDNPVDRMTATRAGIRHMQNGGALLIFGTGLIDPDPAVYPGAMRHIDNWSPSIDLFLRTVPGLLLVPCIVSSVVSPKWAHHPITLLRRIDWQKRRIAEFGQVLQQLFRPGTLYVNPRICFGPPVDLVTLRAESSSERVLPAVISRGKALLKEHCETFGGCAML